MDNTALIAVARKMLKLPDTTTVTPGSVEARVLEYFTQGQAFASTLGPVPKEVELMIPLVNAIAVELVGLMRQLVREEVQAVIDANFASPAQTDENAGA